MRYICWLGSIIAFLILAFKDNALGAFICFGVFMMSSLLILLKDTFT